MNALYLLSLTLVSVFSVHGQLPPEIVPPSPPVLTADFDGDGIVDMSDLTMLEVGLGTDDDRVDLNDDGTVSLLDLFIFADQFNDQRKRPSNLNEEHPDGPIHVPDATYTAFLDAGRITVRTPALELITNSGAPFGIISLRAPGQRSDFAHLQLPLADWEWLTYRRPGYEPLLERKLLWDRWRGPLVETSTDSLLLTYRMDSVMRPAVDLTVRYTIRASDPEFDIAYTVSNETSHALESPFAMIGFPGFSNHAAIGEVTTVAQTRRPQPPHRSFASEAVAKGLAEYRLLRRAAGPGEDRLSASIAVIEEGITFRLHTAVALPHELKAHVAHINKPAYMTSHLYASMVDLAAGATRSIVVRYKLSIESPDEELGLRHQPASSGGEP